MRKLAEMGCRILADMESPRVNHLPASPPALVVRPERVVAALGFSEFGDERLLLAGVGCDPLPYASSKYSKSIPFRLVFFGVLLLRPRRAIFF